MTEARREVGTLERMKTFGIIGFAAAAVIGLCSPAAAGSRAVEVQLLALNDFHGHLESTTPGAIQVTTDPTSRIPAGGAEFLATHLRRLEAASDHTLIVSAGDLIGASPLISALFDDEPTIEAMNLVGLDLNAVGNHEFDEGAAELRRMQEGGCHVDGCFGGDGFDGADFRFLAANVVDRVSRKPLFAPYAIRTFNKIKVGFIGMTLQGTPDIVSQAGIRDLAFLDEADTANRYARELRKRHGVRAIVVLLHEGGSQVAPFGVNSCNGISGPIVDIVNRTSRAVDLFVTGHTHQPYNCVIDERPVTSASSFGRLVTDLDLTLDRRSREIVEVRANNRVISQDVERAADLTALITRYDALAAPLANRVIGRITAAITRDSDDSGENAGGNLIADAQLAATREAGAVAAFMNPGGVRADIAGDGDVTYGDAFSVQPFGNSLVTMTLTGGQLAEMLKQQWCDQASPRILLPSRGVTYTWNAGVAAQISGTACTGAPSPVSDLRIDGQPVLAEQPYRITVNSFLADGGDRFFVLRSGGDRTGGALDLDALEAYLAGSLTGAAVAPPALDRITRAP
jgi:5'-nucleotidase